MYAQLRRPSIKQNSLGEGKGSVPVPNPLSFAAGIPNSAMLGLMERENEHNPASTPNRTGLPDAMKARMERLSGLSLDDVRVHRNSDKPAEIGAAAYARGNEIHLGPGQEEHLEHELGHVVQQKHGMVTPNLYINGLSVNYDKDLESRVSSYFFHDATASKSASGETIQLQPYEKLKKHVETILPGSEASEQLKQLYTKVQAFLEGHKAYLNVSNRTGRRELLISLLFLAKRIEILANEISQKTKDENLLSLSKFPHVELAENEDITIADLPGLLTEVRKKSKEYDQRYKFDQKYEMDEGKNEIGLFEHKEGLGLVLSGSSTSPNTHASVSLPRNNLHGYQSWSNTRFLAHTHPVNTQLQQKEEFTRDTQQSTQMEMVIREDNELVLYDNARVFNKRKETLSGHMFLGDEYDFFYEFNKAIEQLKLRCPNSDRDQFVEKAKAELVGICTETGFKADEVSRLIGLLKTTSLTNPEYKKTYKAVQDALNKLRAHELPFRSFLRKLIPSKQAPDVPKKPFPLDTDSSDGDSLPDNFDLFS